MAFLATDFDLSNCTLTAALYNILRTSGTDPLPFLRPVLSSTTTFSDQSLRSDLHNSTFVAALVSTSITQCMDVICKSLNFNGNADIAGVGAIFSYGLIALLSTSFFLILQIRGVNVFGLRDRLYQGKDYEIELKEATSFASTHALAAFGDTMLGLSLMTQIAFWAYYPQMHSLYEFVIAQLVTRLIACATNTIALWILYVDTDDLKEFRTCFWILCSTGGMAIGVFSWFAEELAQRHGFIDVPCSQIYQFPLKLVGALTIFYIVLTVAFLLLFGGLYVDKIYDFLTPSSNPYPNLSPMGWIGLTWLYIELLMVWMSFALIIVVRQRAQSLFGSKYSDNAVGYGQIMAVGFCSQILLRWVYEYLRQLKNSRRKSSLLAHAEDHPESPDDSSAVTAKTSSISAEMLPL